MAKPKAITHLNWVAVPYILVSSGIIILAGLTTTSRWAQVRGTWTLGGQLPTAVTLDVGLLEIDATVKFPISLSGGVDSIMIRRSTVKFTEVKEQLPQQQKGSLEAFGLNIVSIIIIFSFIVYAFLVFFRVLKDTKFTHLGAMCMTILQAVFLGATFLHWNRNVAQVPMAGATAAPGTGTTPGGPPPCPAGSSRVTLDGTPGCWVGEGSAALKAVAYMIFALIATFAQFVACMFALSFVTCCSADTWLYSGNGIFVGKVNPAPRGAQQQQQQSTAGAHQRTSPEDMSRGGAGVGAVAVGGDFESSAQAGLHQRRRASGAGGTTIAIRAAAAHDAGAGAGLGAGPTSDTTLGAGAGAGAGAVRMAGDAPPSP
eukprot:tig00000857_g4952.t1